MKDANSKIKWFLLSMKNDTSFTEFGANCTTTIVNM